MSQPSTLVTQATQSSDRSHAQVDVTSSAVSTKVSTADQVQDLALTRASSLHLNYGAVLASASLVFAAAAMRLIPHPPNFTPIAGMALFGAATMKRRELALLLPLTALFLSDCILGFHDQIISVYISFLLMSLLGLVVLRKKRTPIRILGTALTSSMLFFVITNSAVVFSGSFYPHTLSGIMLSWTEGLPFLGNTVGGDLLSTAALFGVWAIVEHVLPIKVCAEQPSAF